MLIDSSFIELGRSIIHAPSNLENLAISICNFGMHNNPAFEDGLLRQAVARLLEREGDLASERWRIRSLQLTGLRSPDSDLEKFVDFSALRSLHMLDCTSDKALFPAITRSCKPESLRLKSLWVIEPRGSFDSEELVDLLERHAGLEDVRLSIGSFALNPRLLRPLTKQAGTLTSLVLDKDRYGRTHANHPCRCDTFNLQ